MTGDPLDLKFDAMYREELAKHEGKVPPISAHELAAFGVYLRMKARVSAPAPGEIASLIARAEKYLSDEMDAHGLGGPEYEALLLVRSALASLSAPTNPNGVAPKGADR